MKLLVCVKAVYSVGAVENGLPGPDFQPDEPLVMNRFDEFAMEEALAIRAAVSDTVIEVVSMGPAGVLPVIRRAVGMGADCGIHILSDWGPLCTPDVTAACIAAMAKNRGYDLIITGVMSEDLMQQQVGAMIAGMLDLPCATAVMRETPDPAEKTIDVERELEGGDRELLRLTLPAVVTVQSGINVPRYPSLSNMLRANRMTIETLTAGTLQSSAPKQTIIDVGEPRKTRAGRVLDGTLTEKADQLIAILRQSALMQ